MKLIGHILALYLILLAAVPCCSFDSCPDDKSDIANHEKRDNDCGNCSPFFNCEGCATATIAYEPASFEISAIRISPVYTTYLQSALPTVDFDVWQPPKLV